MVVYASPPLSGGGVEPTHAKLATFRTMWSHVALERVQTLCLVPKGTRKRKYLQLDLHALACRLAAEF